MGLTVYGTPEDAPLVPSPTVKPVHRDDLAYLMYTDHDIAEVIRKLEERRAEAVDAGRDDQANKLKSVAAALETSGQEIGVRVREYREMHAV